MEIITKKVEETKRAAAELIKKIDQMAHQGALVLALEGELGAGKTAFTQGLAKALGIEEKVLSPTFVIMKHFNIPSAKTFNNLYHLDCYRLSGETDLGEIGFKEILKGQANLVVIEWAERVKKILPKDAVWIKFEHAGEDNRRITII
ncbi:MAG TPA: tRNA (adenosine(37)-N6)-threonylcarbamoyltransferase complex ATPase subunit type 1 TsaE [Candidatus Portnoybacteria bacterium]|nr:tRNA (adenosine(37)-N6)-threonylcarbamoyltransferase complex ATPase subunit type 1 TsaE [Candidatus Portnoybacteria bacterium]